MKEDSLDPRQNTHSLLSRAILFYGACLPNHPRKWWLHPWLRNKFGIVHQGETEVVRGGLKWSLDPSDYAHSDLYWLGTKDRWEIYHLKRLLRPQSTLVDAGANFGYYVATLARALKKQCRILAIEPHPENFARLVRHIRLNDLQDVIECCEVGVSDVAGRGTMVIPANNSGHAKIVSNQEDGGVAITTLDTFVQTHGLEQLDAILVDVEGYEARALRGAANTLDRFRPLVYVEFWPPVMQQQGTSVEAVVEVLEEHQYKLFFAHRRKLLPLLELPTGDQGIQAFCFHKDSVPARLG